MPEPFLEADLAKLRIAGRNQGAFGEFGSEISRVRIDDDLARVVTRAKALANQVIEPELLGTSDIHRVIQRRTQGHFLGILRSQVGTVGYALGSHDRQRNVVLHTGCGRVLEKVAR